MIENTVVISFKLENLEKQEFFEMLMIFRQVV